MSGLSKGQKKQRVGEPAASGGRAASRLEMSRRAFARPRVLLSLMTVLLVGGSWWAMAQKSAPVQKTGKPAAATDLKNRRPITWADLPGMVAEYGQRRRAQASLANAAGSSGGGAVGKDAVSGGISKQRFPLTEVDLTPGNVSDEREPNFRAPVGDFIAFASDGADANRDGFFDPGVRGRFYHIWIIGRDGRSLQQVTGLGRDANRSQRAPTWSPDGTRICYVDEFSASLTHLSIVANVVNSPTPPLPLQITFFPGQKRDPAWSPGGEAIAFASDVAPTANNSGVPAGGFDIFTISPSGSTLTVRRLTGDPDNNQSSAGTPSDPQDLAGNTTDDRRPAYSQQNPGVLFFSSNRETVITSDGTTTTATTNRLAAGRRIFVMDAFNGAGKRQVTNPVARGGTAADEDDFPTASRAGTLPRGRFTIPFAERIAFQTNSRIDARDTVRDLNVWSLPVATLNRVNFLNNPAGTLGAFEGSQQAAGNVAQVETNTLSTAVPAGSFVGATQDTSADREPAFSRASNNSPSLSTLVFASQRRTAGRPSSNSQAPAPLVVNPGGGSAAGSTHDLWTTASQDFAPPLLVPVSVGNQQFPFLAPGRQAPFFAPRTAEEGLGQGAKLIIGVVVSDQESGLNTGLPRPTPTAVPLPTATAVPTPTTVPTEGPPPTPDPDATATAGPTAVPTATATPIVAPPAVVTTLNSVSVRIRSSVPTFQSFVTRPNESVPIVHEVEQNPPYVTEAIPLSVFDNGSPGQGGAERQANAIRGDGIYYAQGSLDITQLLGNLPQGDFFIDLIVTDRAGNSLTYDKVYGFSTEPFSKRANLLFVSDYTQGQSFPAELSGRDRAGRNDPFVQGFSNLFVFDDDGNILQQQVGLPPVESYHLSNPSGAATDFRTISGNGRADATTFSPPGSATFGQAPTSVDVYRILARGPVSTEVLRLYQPQAGAQIDPNAPGLELNSNVTVTPTATPLSNPTPSRTAEPLPTRAVTIAENAIVWAAPYTGTVLASPGTIFDADTQRRLTDYLNAGGRMFLNGQDIIFALSNAGTVDNDFLRDELKASWNGQQGETGAADELTPNYGYDINGDGSDPQIANRVPNGGDAPLKLHVPFNSGSDLNSTYWEAADNDSFGDVIRPVDAGDGNTIQQVYTYGNGLRAAQRIERSNRDRGLLSKVVFFAFGLEHVNRERTADPALGSCRNYRSKIAENVANYLRTGRITGRVINALTGQPIPNFLVQVTDGNFQNRFYLARTDANGFYEIAGVEPLRNYRVSPASQLIGTGANSRLRSLNPGFFVNQNILAVVGVIGGQTTSNINFSVNPAPPSTIFGRAISDRGTPNNLGDDDDDGVQVAPNLPVLLRSLDPFIAPSSSFPLGGSFAQLVQTDASGQFVFDNVPSDLRVEIIFNPLPGPFDPANPRASTGDIPVGSGINYNTPTALIQRNPNFGRRVILSDASYRGPRPPGITDALAAQIVSGNSIVVPVGASINIGDVPVPPGGRAITGRVLRAGVAASGAVVQLLAGGVEARSTVTNVQGVYTLRDVPPGTYTVRATQTVGGVSFAGQITVTVGSTTDVAAPNIILLQVGAPGTPGSTPTPRPPGPTPTPTSPANETFQPGQQYMISFPFSVSTAPTATATVSQVLNAPPISGGVTNYRLIRYDPLRSVYVDLTATSLVRRGEGYFLRPLARGVSFREPGVGTPRLFPTGVSEFTITLRRDPSRRDNNNGFNLIGFPFDPARFSASDWLNARVIAPNGTVYPTLSAAVGAGLVSPTLFTLQDGTTNYMNVTTLTPRRGYFARTFVDNVRVVLKARR